MPIVFADKDEEIAPAEAASTTKTRLWKLLGFQTFERFISMKSLRHSTSSRGLPALTLAALGGAGVFVVFYHDKVGCSNN